jgi:NTP pyrophosphatase (non-canonical NTP hydrolase)
MSEIQLLTFAEYQDRVPDTVLPQVRALGWLYPLLGIGGEAGETLEKFKKIVRDKLAKVLLEQEDLPATGFLSGLAIMPDEKRAIAKELGDQLWYIAWMCVVLNLDMGQVARDNLKKLLDRQERGTLGGSGDDR